MRTLPTRVFSYRASLPAGQTSSYMSMERRLSSVWIEHISEVQSREVLVKLPGTGSFPLMVSFHWLLMVNRNATFWYNFPLSGFFPKFNYFKKFSILWLQKTVIISLLMMIIWAFFSCNYSFYFCSLLHPCGQNNTKYNVACGQFLSRVVYLFHLDTLSSLMLLALILSI